MRIAAKPTTTTSPPTARSSRADAAVARRSKTMRPRTKKATAKVHQARTDPSVHVAPGLAAARLIWCLHVRMKDGGRATTVHPGPKGSPGHGHQYFRPRRRALRSGFGGVVAALALDPVHRPVGRGDESVAGPAVDRERGDADRRSDRHRAALLADEGVVAEGVEDPSAARSRLAASVSGRITANSSPP